MNWKEIKVSEDNSQFMHNNKPIFKRFTEVLKFHEPGIAAVSDTPGWYHINAAGEAIYLQRYRRTFGFYQNRAAVIEEDKWFHIDIDGKPLYEEKYAFTGNFQYGCCVVRDFDGNYFYIDTMGKRISEKNYRYAGDYKDNYACVMLTDGSYKHIDKSGTFIYNSSFNDLGVYHKGFATAKDENGWFHIDIKGNGVYLERYAFVEPFYNGCALVQKFDGSKIIIDEQGKCIHSL